MEKKFVVYIHRIFGILQVLNAEDERSRSPVSPVLVCRRGTAVKSYIKANMSAREILEFAESNGYVIYAYKDFYKALEETKSCKKTTPPWKEISEIIEKNPQYIFTVGYNSDIGAHVVVAEPVDEESDAPITYTPPIYRSFEELALSTEGVIDFDEFISLVVQSEFRGQAKLLTHLLEFQSLFQSNGMSAKVLLPPNDKGHFSTIIIRVVLANNLNVDVGRLELGDNGAWTVTNNLSY